MFNLEQVHLLLSSLDHEVKRVGLPRRAFSRTWRLFRGVGRSQTFQSLSVFFPDRLNVHGIEPELRGVPDNSRRLADLVEIFISRKLTFFAPSEGRRKMVDRRSERICNERTDSSRSAMRTSQSTNRSFLMTEPRTDSSKLRTLRVEVYVHQLRGTLQSCQRRSQARRA